MPGLSIQTYGQNLAHDIGGGAAHVLAEVVECLQVGFVQGIAYDLNVHLVQILLGDAINKERRQRRIHQHGIVELSGRGCHMYRLHLLKAAQRMAFGYQLRNGTLVQRARDQQYDIIDHIAVRDKVQEVGQRLHRMVAHMLELDHQLLAQLVIDHGHRQRRRLVGQKAAVVRALQMQLQI